MSARIESLLQFARGRIAAWLPALEMCEIHDGPVDAAEVARWRIRTPAVLVALLGVRSVQACSFPRAPKGGYGGRPGAAKAKLQLAAFALADDDRAEGSGWRRCRAMCERIAAGVAVDPWTGDGICFPRGRPEGIRVTTLYSGAQDRTGVALMAVAWEQEIEIAEPEGDGLPDRPLPSALYRGIAPETGAEHADDYDRLEPPEDSA